MLGSPVAHSLSPVIHNAGYAAAGLRQWRYEARECRREELKPLVDSLDASWAGLSLTMPLKEVALEVADEVSTLARALGAANTLVFDDDGVHADNTDAPGMTDALADVGVAGAANVAVLGAGGTARAALGASQQLGATQVTVYARRRAKAEAELDPTAQRLGATVAYLDWDRAAECGSADVVMSTVPKGAADGLDVRWRSAATFFDVVYDPWPTPLASSAAAAGCTVVDGLALLLAQAVRQFRMFTGVDAPREAMRRALYAAREDAA